MTQIYDHHLEPYELTIAQFGVLAQLRALPGSGVGELAHKMIMDATTLSRSLRLLERRGLVACEADRADGRARKLRLTPAGRVALENAMAGWSAAQKQIEEALGASGMRDLNAMLDSTLDRLST